MVPLPNETGASCKLEVLSELKDQNGLLGELKYSYKQTNSKLIGEGKHGSNNIWTEGELISFFNTASHEDVNCVSKPISERSHMTSAAEGEGFRNADRGEGV